MSCTCRIIDMQIGIEQEECHSGWQSSEGDSDESRWSGKHRGEGILTGNSKDRF